MVWVFVGLIMWVSCIDFWIFCFWVWVRGCLCLGCCFVLFLVAFGFAVVGFLGVGAWVLLFVGAYCWLLYVLLFGFGCYLDMQIWCGWILMLYLVCCRGLVFIYFAVYYLVVFCMVDFLSVLVADCGLC